MGVFMFKNLNLLWRILGGFFIITILSVAIGLIAYTGIRSISREEQLLSAVKDWEVQMLDVNEKLRSFVVTGDLNDRDAAVQRSVQLASMLSQLRNQLRSSDSISLLEQI